MRDRKGVDPGRSGDEEGWDRVEGRETIIKIYYIIKICFQEKEKQSKKKRQK